MSKDLKNKQQIGKAEENLSKQQYHIIREMRNKQNKHRSFVVWFTGLSGSGKSTIANRLENTLFDMGIHTYILDGDNIRLGINKGLGFSGEDRHENLRRIAEIAKLFVDNGTLTLAAFISPTEKDRELVKNIIGKDDFIEVFIDTDIAECERRDVKGLYKKARAGEIKNFTGIDAPYERPLNPDIHIDTKMDSLEIAVNKIINFISPLLQPDYTAKR